MADGGENPDESLVGREGDPEEDELGKSSGSEAEANFKRQKMQTPPQKPAPFMVQRK